MSPYVVADKSEFTLLLESFIPKVQPSKISVIGI